MGAVLTMERLRSLVLHGLPEPLYLAASNIEIEFDHFSAQMKAVIEFDNGWVAEPVVVSAEINGLDDSAPGYDEWVAECLMRVA